jgi:hypothetical protein
MPMLTEAEKALLAFIGTSGKSPDEVKGFDHDPADLQTLIEAGYVVLNRNTVPDTVSDAGERQSHENFLSYALTSAGIFEIPQP